MGIAALALTLAGCATGSAPGPAAPASVGRSVAPLAAASIGALFPGGLTGLHICTASVVHSPAGNVIATAAHCIAGTGAGVVFAPGYRNGAAPYGTWTVTGAYAAPAWIQGRDPRADVAFLVVAPSPDNPAPASVEQAVGGSTLSVAPADGTTVTGTGYALGAGDSPLSCSAATTTADGYPTLPCGPLPAGTSGGPWTVSAGGATQLVGLIGGLHQGGCTADVSHSPPFTAATAALLARAATGGPADTLPPLGGDGC